MGWTLVLVAIFAVSSPADDEKETTPPAMPPPATQHWSKPYRDLHELVGKLESQVSHHFFPEFTIIKEGNTIANISVDAFAATVLGEADSTLFAYRASLQNCIDKNTNEYRASGQIYSYQHYAWSLDNYTKLLVGAIAPQEDAPAVNGVREKKVTTDRTWYALSRLLMAYLEEKTDRDHMKATEGETFASDRALLASISDVARRVFRLDLNAKFDRQEYLLKGAVSQPVFRDLASTENGKEVKSGGEPLAKLVAEKDATPVCKITLPPRKKGDKSHSESNDIVFSR